MRKLRFFGLPAIVLALSLAFTGCGDGAGNGGGDGDGSVSVTGVTLNKATTSIAVGANETLTATVAPANATNQAVTWSSSDTSKATVVGGVVTAVATGTATITITTTDGSHTAACVVTVTSAVPVTGVTLNKATASIAVGANETLTATVAPANATNQAVTWSSDATAIATVADGVVTAVVAGTATITVTTTDGSHTAACVVTVTPGGGGTDLKTKFSVSTASDTFTALHNLIQTDGNWADQIALGDYIDLPSLTIAGSGMITDLRLIVVGKNSFKRNSTGAGSVTANNPGAPDHVVFQFQNIPVTHNMNGTNTNVGGYAGSAMKTYLTGDFLTGLKTATGLTSTELWAPSRRVWNGFLSGESGSSSTNTTVNTITDALWLPTEWEMFGFRTDSSPDEVNAGQARLEYYASPSARKKYNNSISVWYWSASPQHSSAAGFAGIHSYGNPNSYYAEAVGGCAPAFCVQ
ncbi:hypothetical protein AGMMS49940_20600 [Spirochaetia bacterium]|nr:hypothetical protein AGMMS49940_20600 [Spirochaetia bacterium]